MEQMKLYLDSSFEDVLAHYGVKGMRWGVRKKDDPSGPLSPPPGVKISRDGSMSIEKGASIQRLVRSNGKSLPMKDITYASMTQYDNARYVKIIGGKGVFGGGRDQILGITATSRITAPPYLEATRINSELMLSNPAYVKSLEAASFSGKVPERELSQIRADPVGKTAQAWYEQTNTALTFTEDWAPGITYAQQTLRKAVEDKGYNALRDENDFSSGVSKAPIIIFSPEKSLKVTSVTNITDELRRSNKDTLKQYKSRGKDWVEREIYGG